MKEILIRNLDSPKKADLVKILTEYLNRNYVDTIASSTALEQLIREFHKNEISSKAEISKLKEKVREQEQHIYNLNSEKEIYSSKHQKFVNSFNDLLNHKI